MQYFVRSLLVSAFFSVTIIAGAAPGGDSSIRVNQLGYYTHAPKTAVVTGNTGDAFFVVNAGGGDTVYRGNLEAYIQSINSSIRTRVARFDACTATGSYVIVTSGGGSSPVFAIKEKVLEPLAASALKGYYYQRVSMPLEERFAGKWHRSAGHPDTAVLIHPSAASAKRPALTKIATPGGWYDAGDYNKYVVNSGITMGTLLSAYEDFPGYFQKLQTHIPESGNGIPDILNECLYNLRWMLTMQDPNDGGVYNKCTNAAFDGMVMPGVTKAPRYVVAKGTAATLDFAAVTAQAARILQAYNQQLPGLADSCRNAALKAWQWAQKNPSLAYEQDVMNKKFSPPVTTGGYGDQSFADEWFWAASELWITLQQPVYLQAIKQYMATPFVLPSWSNVHALGCYSLLRNKAKLKDDAMLQTFKQQVMQQADSYAASIAASAFGCVMGQSKTDYEWGSNSVAANQGIVLMNAWLITQQPVYLNAALTNINYLMGCNATGYCFVTGLGTKSPMHPHHRPSVADGITEPVPGLLVGGPNPGRQDHCNYLFTEPETAYLDTDPAYASNEIAINWNAPLVYLANAIEAAESQTNK